MSTRSVQGILGWAAALAMLVAGVTAAGCGEATPPPGSEETLPDTLVTRLMEIDDAAFRAAFLRLDSLDYTRYTRTEQFDGDQFMVAYREYVSRITNGLAGSRIDPISADSAGAFQFGFFNRFVSQSGQEMDPVDMVPFVLQEEPSYLRPRNTYKYSFSERADTLLWDTQARVIEVTALPVTGDGENTRRVRYYFSRSAGELLAIYLERIDLALLFREESSFYVHMRPGPDGGLVPYNTRFDTVLKTPFRDDHRFRTVSTYYEYAIPGR